jgi:D-glycero-D-manno-heptose 1,7-bisphosphate phosphatase
MSRPTHRAVFLDRDGVLNRTYLHEDGKTHPPNGPEETEILPGVPEACLDLRRAGFLLIVVTNQPDVARGTQRQPVVAAIHEKLRQKLSLDEIMVCYHDSADNCSCRKPKPGLLMQAAAVWGINLKSSFMVGDRGSDMEAGYAAGCKTVLIRSAPLKSEKSGQREPDFQADSLAEAAKWIVNEKIKSGKTGQHIPTSHGEFVGRNR